MPLYQILFSRGLLIWKFAKGGGRQKLSAATTVERKAFLIVCLVPDSWLKSYCGHGNSYLRLLD